MPRRSIRRKAKRRTKHIKVIGGSDKPARPARPARAAPLNPVLMEAALKEDADIRAFKTKLHEAKFDADQMFVLSIMAGVIYSLALGHDISKKNLAKMHAIQQY